MTRPPLRVVFGQPHFFDRFAWQDVLAHLPADHASRIRIETVAANGIDARASRPTPIDVLVPVMSTVSAEALASGVRFVQQFGVGVEQIDLDAAASLGVTVANMPGLNAPFVAERAVALLLSLLHRLPESRLGFKEGHWSTPSGRSLAGSTGCVVGLGAIGRAVAERLVPFGTTILGVHRSVPPAGSVPDSVQLVPTNRILEAVSRADYVIVAATHENGAAPVLDSQVVSALPPGCVVVNVARGGAIDNDACLAALEAGTLAGIGLDVFPVEPYPADGPLLSHPGVLATAHTAALTDAYFAAASRRLGAAIADFEAGRPVANTVTGAVSSGS